MLLRIAFIIGWAESQMYSDSDGVAGRPCKGLQLGPLGLDFLQNTNTVSPRGPMHAAGGSNAITSVLLSHSIIRANQTINYQTLTCNYTKQFPVRDQIDQCCYSPYEFATDRLYWKSLQLRRI